MANYTVKAPDGSTHVIAGPDGASDEEVISQAQKLFPQQSQMGGKPPPASSFGELSNLINDPNKSKIRKAWDSLTIPAQMSQRGLQGIADAVPGYEPKGNDILKSLVLNTPKVAANTMAQAAPGFVSRGAMATSAAMPMLKGLGSAAKAVGPGIAGQLESLSGMKPGLLGKAFNDMSLYFAKIPQEARDAYQASSDFVKTSPEVSGTPQPLRLAQKLLAKAKTGMISTDEALAGRKAVDKLWKLGNITEDWKNMARETFDTIAKSQSEIKEADTAFSRGKDSAGLRQLFPQNKYGGTSAFKTGIMALMNSMGPVGKVGMAAMSPAAMGAGATALGAASRPLGALANNPQLAVVIQQLIKNLSLGNTPQPQQGSGIQ